MNWVFFTTFLIPCKGHCSYSACLNDYAEFDSKNSYIMFLNDYLLVCEISTIRTLTLTTSHQVSMLLYGPHSLRTHNSMYVLTMNISGVYLIASRWENLSCHSHFASCSRVCSFTVNRSIWLTVFWVFHLLKMFN